MTDMRYLGIDCGQTHLEAVMATAHGEVIWRGKGGPSHIQGADMTSVLAASVEEALSKLPQGEVDQVRAIGLGVTGLDIPGKREAVQSVMQRLYPGTPVYIDNDAVTCFWGASQGGDGASVLAGTGTVAFGKNGPHRRHMGGFGYLLGDEGGGLWIGLEAIKRSLRAAEQRELPTSLLEPILQAFGVENHRHVLGGIYSPPAVDVRKIASLTYIVSLEAQKGDAVANQVLADAGEHLASLTCRLLSALAVHTDDPFAIFRIGGVWNIGHGLLNAYEVAVARKYPNLQWSKPHSDPAVGAALMARDLSA